MVSNAAADVVYAIIYIERESNAIEKLRTHRHTFQSHSPSD